MEWTLNGLSIASINSGGSVKIVIDDVSLYRKGYCYWCPLFNRGVAIWTCKCGFLPDNEGVSPAMNGLLYKRDPRCIEEFGE